MSDIIPGTVADADSPKRYNSTKATSIHTNDALSQFIKEQLVRRDFCMKMNFRNNAVAEKLIVLQSESSAPQPQGTSSVPLAPIDSAWEILRNVLTSTKETTIHGPLCRFLTLLSDKEFLFIPCQWHHKTHGEGELYLQDIIVVNARPEEIDRFLDGDQTMDLLPSDFTYCDEDDELNPRVYSDVQMVGEVKTGTAPPSPFDNAVQVLKHLFTVSRHQPQHSSHIGILVYRDGFIIIDYYPDQAFFSRLFNWQDKDAAWEALRCAIADVRRRHFTTEQFASIKPSDYHGLSRLQFCLSGGLHCFGRTSLSTV